MDPVFVEETENLKRVENRLDQIISSYEARKAALQKELSGFVSYDYEDRTRYIEMRKDLQSEERYADQYRAYKPSPYFARMDLDTEIDGTDDIETMVVFIGKEGIHQGTELLVIDWRSDVGQYYYMKSERSFKINGYAYQLVLRRALDIDGGKLLSYNTEYDSANVTLEGDIVDPFLLTVLKDKRRHNRLTDIIRTIQANQNDIIRRPRQESFVVQGCAGSGKTMILLHRLSFLLFNNRNLSPASIKIITPNKFFDAHINELSHELGLDQITRYTVEEYYVELIHRFSSRIEVEASVNSEKDLSVPLLESVYSPEYADRFAQHYHDYWNEITKKLSELGLPDVFEQYKRIYPDISVHQSATYATLENSLREIQRDIERRRDEKKRLSERLAAIHTETIRGELLLKAKEYNVTTTAQKINHFDLQKHSEQAKSAHEIISFFHSVNDAFFEGKGIQLAGHNTQFDVQFIKKLFADNHRSYEKTFSHRIVDTYSILRFMRDAKKIELESLTSAKAFSYFGIKVEGRHSALGDAEATMRLYEKLLGVM